MTAPMKVNDRMVWIELATSGPDPEAHRIEHVAAVVTDKELAVVGATALAVDDATASEAALLALVKEHVAEGAGLLAGARVQEVRLFLAAHMPGLFGYLHYRNVDVTTVRELVRRWYPDAHAARPRGDGLDAALAELRHYRDTVFRPADPTG